MDAFGGEAIGLFCGFIWALNGIITRTQSHKVSPMLMNAIRCGSAGLCFWIGCSGFGRACIRDGYGCFVFEGTGDGAGGCGGVSVRWRGVAGFVESRQ